MMPNENPSVEDNAASIASEAISASPDAVSGNWLPCNFSFNPSAASVTWVDFGPIPMAEPFFNHTIRRLARMAPPARKRTTGLSTLIDATRQLPPARPAGLIFHISRCGSTFLANALRTGERIVVLSEARPVETFFQSQVFAGSPFPPEGWEKARRMLLECVIGIYAASAARAESCVVIKCCAVDAMKIRLIRSVWPDVPFVVLIRDPLEVVVSNLALPAAWCRLRKQPAADARVFGAVDFDVQQLLPEEYYARGVGRFCAAAAEALDEKCKVVDYAGLTPETIHRIAAFFNIAMPSAESPIFQDVIATYAKDPDRARRFENDRERKQRAAGELARQSVRRWAQESYEELRAHADW